MPDINKGQLDLVDSLVNPDNPKEQQTYKWDFELQQRILGMLVSDKHFLIQGISLIKPEYFVDEAHVLIAKILFAHFSKYKQLPSKIVLQNEITEQKKNHPHIAYYAGELEAVISSYIPGLDSRDYLLDKIKEFAKERAVYLAVSRTIDTASGHKENKWSAIWDIWRNALSTDRNYDMGLDYFTTLEERYERMMVEREGKEIFTSGFSGKMLGIEGIDEALACKGLCRGEIGAFLAPSGVGKSMALVNAAARNIALGKKVLYITLEMNADKIAKRMDAILSGIDYNDLVSNKDIVIDAIKESVKDEEDKRILRIVHFAGGTADVNTFRAYLSQAALDGFKPDLIIVDYVGEMKDVSGVDTWEGRQRQVRDLRALAVEEDCCILTALQSNRKGLEDQKSGGQVDDGSIAESYGQVRPLDALWGMDRVGGLLIGDRIYAFGKIFIAKHRDGRSKFDIYYKQDMKTLVMTIITFDIYKELLNKYNSNKNLATVTGKG